MFNSQFSQHVGISLEEIFAFFICDKKNHTGYSYNSGT